jgi:hypothetical protein
MKKDNDTTNATLLTRPQFGEAVFQAVKSELTSRGFALTSARFDPDYPISLRQIHYIRRGEFNVAILKRLPFIRYEEKFEIIEK